MRRKSLPPPPDDLETLRAAHRAVPLVPGTETDCCARLQGRLELPARDVAATWLDFLRGLGLADEGPSGFSRVRTAFDEDELSRVFLDRVFGAREVLAVLDGAEGPLDVGTVADRTADVASAWEQQKHGTDWPAVWQDRTERLLGWLVLLDLIERVDGRYRPAATD